MSVLGWRTEAFVKVMDASSGPCLPSSMSASCGSPSLVQDAVSGILGSFETFSASGANVGFAKLADIAHLKPAAQSN